MTSRTDKQHVPAETCERKPLYRIFEESARLGGDFTLRNTGIPVSTILYLVDHFGEQKVKELFPNLRDRDYEICRTIAAHLMPERPEFKRNGPNARVNILFDENVHHRIVEKCLNNISKLAHISFHGLTSDKDETIWDFAKANGFDVIITNDDDFIKIAEMDVLTKLFNAKSFEGIDISDMPLVVFMEPSIRNPEVTEDAVRRRIQNFAAEAQRRPRRMAYLCMGAADLTAGPDVKDIYKRYIRESISGSPVLEKELIYPVFDTKILDHKAINALRGKFGMRPLDFTTRHQRLYKRAYGAKRRQIDSSVSPS